MSPRLLISLRVYCLTIATTHVLVSSGFAAWPNGPNINVPVCTASGDQNSPTIVADGAGGTITVWVDNRAGNQDIYIRGVSASGVPLWTADGVAVCTATGAQDSPVIVSDGADGAIVAWHDVRGATEDIYAQRVNSSGVPQWTADGVVLSSATGQQNRLSIVSDGAGGAIVLWIDGRAGQGVVAQRVNAGGVPQWTANGVSLGGSPVSLSATSDGAGGAIATWKDIRNLFSFPPVLEIDARPITAGGVPQWAVGGVLVGSYPTSGVGDIPAATSNPPVITSDGAGGAIIAWTTLGNAVPGDIFSQHVNSSGALLWGAGGVALCTAPGDQSLPRLASDGVNGAIVAWQDSRTMPTRIFARQVNGSGTPLWGTDGIIMCTAIGSQTNASIVSDGEGGAIVTWQDARSVSQDIYAQRVNSSGERQWTLDGLAICTAAASQSAPSLAAVGTGRAVWCWTDLRNGATSDIFAQGISSLGCAGAQEPSLVGVRDVPNDQGGRVKLSWLAPCADAWPPQTIDSYWIWRSAPPNEVQAARARGARIVHHGDEIVVDQRRIFLAVALNAATYYWEYMTSQPAGHLDQYSYVAATTSDSAGSNPYTAFMIQARTAAGAAWWYSSPDSGYSVDNLSPIVPGPFIAQFFPGGSPPFIARTSLHWNPNSESDFLEYRLYRGTSADFVPGPDNLLVAKRDTGYIDVGTAGGYYKLLALDIHGNISRPAVLTPNDIAGTETPRPGGLWLGSAWPNPARDEILFRFGIPQEAEVSLEVFDAGGRLVRQLVRSRMASGEHALRWDARDAGGRPSASGVYWTRLEVHGVALRKKFTLLR